MMSAYRVDGNALRIPAHLGPIIFAMPVIMMIISPTNNPLKSSTLIELFLFLLFIFVILNFDKIKIFVIAIIINIVIPIIKFNLSFHNIKPDITKKITANNELSAMFNIVDLFLMNLEAKK